ncbi:DUF6153 family protein [Streptomyces sp. NPDC058045]|uniref:DUF6153 family protein n=1 Tax=Streptomyces sp. NPDC058045 TaxID=3346311 RepID=UPI0036E2650B
MILDGSAPAPVRCRALPSLVLALLAGLLAMHALAPGAALPRPASGAAAGGHGSSVGGHASVAGHYRVAEHTMVVHGRGAVVHRMAAGQPDCPAAGSGGHGGHDLGHADGLCAAPGTAAGYAPPVLTPSAAPAPPAAALPHRLAAARATDPDPPDPVTLQVLRT